MPSSILAWVSCLANPKSHIFSTPFFERSMFSGLKSRWTILWLCMKSHAFRIYQIIFFASSGSIPERSLLPYNSSRIVLFSCSKTKKILLSSLNTSRRSTIWSCFNYFNMRISLKAVFLTYTMGKKKNRPRRHIIHFLSHMCSNIPAWFR